MYDELIEALRLCVKYGKAQDALENAEQAADAIEELSKRLNSVTAERDAAMERLCEWCGVGCSMENRHAELCEIASVGLEFFGREGRVMTTTAEWRKWNAVQTKPITNADRVRAMTDEELADFINNVEAEAIKRAGKYLAKTEIERGKAQRLDWLRQEAADERP